MIPAILSAMPFGYLGMSVEGFGRSEYDVLLCQPVGNEPQDFSILPIGIVEARSVDHDETEAILLDRVGSDSLGVGLEMTCFASLCIPSDTIDELIILRTRRYGLAPRWHVHWSSQIQLAP